MKRSMFTRVVYVSLLGQDRGTPKATAIHEIKKTVLFLERRPSDTPHAICRLSLLGVEDRYIHERTDTRSRIRRKAHRIGQAIRQLWKECRR